MAIEWYPVIDRDKCSNCLVCYEFCQHEVYELKEDTPQVVNPENCIFCCHGCENHCPSGAISYFGDDGRKFGMIIIDLCSLNGGECHLKEKGRLLIKGIILWAIVGLLIFKFAIPKADGPAEITNQVALRQEAI